MKMFSFLIIAGLFMHSTAFAQIDNRLKVEDSLAQLLTIYLGERNTFPFDQIENSDVSIYCMGKVFRMWAVVYQSAIEREGINLNGSTAYAKFLDAQTLFKTDEINTYNKYNRGMIPATNKTISIWQQKGHFPLVPTLMTLEDFSRNDYAKALHLCIDQEFVEQSVAARGIVQQMSAETGKLTLSEYNDRLRQIENR